MNVRVPSLAARVLLGVFMFWLVMASRYSARAETPRTITVSGEGSAAAMPDYVILTGRVEAHADSGAAAQKQFEAMKTKVFKGLGADKHPNWKLTFRGVSPAQPPVATEDVVALAMVDEGGDGPAAAQSFQVTERVEFRREFSGDMDRRQVGDQIAALVDAAAKAGVRFGDTPNIYTVSFGVKRAGAARFILAKPKETMNKAYDAAFKDAQSRAEQLARLAGAKLGKVLSIQESDVASSENPWLQMIAGAGMAEELTGSKAGYSSVRNEPIEIHKRLTVAFELLDK